jgi:hypothetical protein
MNSLKKIKKLNELQKEIDSIISLGIEQFFEDYKDAEDFYILIQGWTPTYNDGQPCKHSVDYCIGNEITKYHHHKEQSHMFKGIDVKDIECSLCPQFLDEYFMDTIIKCLDFEYDTNYQILIIFKENKLMYVKDEYYVGY